MEGFPPLESLQYSLKGLLALRPLEPRGASLRHRRPREMFRAKMARKLARKYPRQGTIIFHSCFTLWSALPLLADVKSAFRYAYHTLINPSKLGSQASKEGFPKVKPIITLFHTSIMKGSLQNALTSHSYASKLANNCFH
jgi:hypothetical protein